MAGSDFLAEILRDFICFLFFFVFFTSAVTDWGLGFSYEVRPPATLP